MRGRDVVPAEGRGRVGSGTVRPDGEARLGRGARRHQRRDGAFWAPSLLDDRNMVYSVPGGEDGSTSCLGWVRYYTYTYTLHPRCKGQYFVI